jgi:hypothetical protein
MKIGTLALAGLTATSIGLAIFATAVGAQVTAPTVDRTLMATAAVKQKTATVVSAGSSVFTYAPRWTWVEKVNGAVVHTYSEDFRSSSGSSIRMSEEGTGRHAVIDFYANTLSYGGERTVPIGWVGTEVNASNLTFVRHAGGSFSMTSKTMWTERGGTSQTFTFRELRRDCCNVYLFDASRNTSISFNLNSKGIFWARGTAQPSKIYDITYASAVQFFSRAIID